MELIEVHVEHGSTAREVKVQWRKEGNSWPQYTVDVDSLNDAAQEIRGRLASLVDRALENEDTNKTAACGAELKALAKAGHSLYKRLFPAGLSNLPSLSRAWLESKGPGHSIKFVVSPRIHIPWGLIYGVDPDPLTGQADDVSWELYQQFWCLKYSLSCMYHAIPPVDDQPRDSQMFKVIAVHNQQAFDQAKSELDKISGEHGLIETIYAKLSGTVCSKSELARRWKEEKHTLGMIFFYCHANESKLALANNDTISIHELSDELVHDQRQVDPVTVFFLNGCNTAVGSDLGGFLEVTSRAGFCGFIGTETEVPNLFALGFSLAFLYGLLYEGLTIGEAMNRLRKQHWPLSLLYSVCCYPRVSVASAGDKPDFSEFLKNNFSSKPVGASKI